MSESVGHISMHWAMISGRYCGVYAWMGQLSRLIRVAVGDNLSRKDHFSPLGNDDGCGDDTSYVIMVVCLKADKKKTIDINPGVVFPHIV